jgi:type II secretory pathway pseudopilin PulG
MITPASMRAQRGATLVVGLILLVLITLMVTTAFTMSTGNLKAVANMQFRSEAIAAANRAIEQVLASPFTDAPVAEEIGVDINNDGSTDYTVWIGDAPGAPVFDPPLKKPTCVGATKAIPSLSSSLSLPVTFSSDDYWNTVWDIDAGVSDPVSGASIRVRQGIRKLLSKAEKTTHCSI